MLPGREVQPAVQHQAQLLELNHVAGLVGVLGQTVEPHCPLSPLSRECKDAASSLVYKCWLS